MNAPPQITAALRADHGQRGGIDYYEVPDGLAGTAYTIRQMQENAVGCAGHLPIKRLANDIVAGVPAHDSEAEAEAIFDWVKNTHRYTRDPIGTEWIQCPCWTAWVEGHEDCDGLACLIAALALSTGNGAAYRTIAADPRRPGEMSHVYALIGVRVKGQERWFAADVTQPQSYLGWEPSVGVTHVRDWVISGP